MSNEARARIDAEPHDAAERAACLQVIERIFDRLSAIESEARRDATSEDGTVGAVLVDGEAIRIEVRRIDASIDGVRQGLHRTETTEGNANGR